jgi:hypothetical protein
MLYPRRCGTPFLTLLSVNCGCAFALKRLLTRLCRNASHAGPRCRDFGNWLASTDECKMVLQAAVRRARSNMLRNTRPRVPAWQAQRRSLYTA